MALAVEPVYTTTTLPAVRRRAARSPARRDVFVDAVRALGTVGIVTLHWLMPEASFDGTTLHVGNALRHGDAWVLTWVAQTLPLMFFAAGAAAAYQRSGSAVGMGPGWGSAVMARLRGVARPVGVFVAAWAVAVVLLLGAGVPDDAVWRLARMAPQLLWFLAVWVLLLPLVPVLQAAWRRWRWWVVGVAVALPLLVDAVRFGAGAEGMAWANVLLVWAVPFVAGVAYATERSEGRRPWLTGDGRSIRWFVLAALAGLAAMAMLVAVGPYPASMVGMPGDAIPNLGPPTAPVVAQSVAQVCAVLAAHGLLTRWAASGVGRDVVGLLSRHAMSVYLWHLTAMFAVVGVVLVGLDQRLPEPWTADWWATRPTWFAAFLLVLILLGRVFGRASGVAPRRRRALA